MQSPRETVYNALLTAAAAAAGIKTFSRRLADYAQVDNSKSPALYLVQSKEQASFTEKTPTIWRLQCDLVLIVITPGDSDAIPASTYNPLVDAIEAALRPGGPGGEQTLGGLVQYARIKGELLYGDGQQETQTLIVIPVEMLTA